ISALTILERVSRRAGAELSGEKGVSARLLRTTGEIYFNLGLVRQAERDLRASIALEPPKSEGRTRALLKLANIAYLRGDIPASAGSIDAAARSYDIRAPWAKAVEAQITERRAMLEVLEGNYAKAALELDKAAILYKNLEGDYRQDLGRVWLNQAQSLVRLRRFAEADKLFAMAGAIYAAKFGTNHVLTADAYRNEAVADFEAGRLAEAEREIQRALAVYDRVLEGDHPTLAAALLMIGRVRSARGNGSGALVALDKARGIFERLYGSDNAAVGDADFYAAEAESVRGNTPAALRRLANTQSIYDRAYGPDDPDQAELLILRSRILRSANRLAEARRD
ncbi:MAG: tetratricopeptide repeat protein, partial [Alphaproteobacteria bacterium]